jgi:hypothetical protein
MRCFLTPDGRVLVEWALADTTVLEPDRTPLGRAGTFHLLDSAGNVVRTWTTTSGAVQETFYTTAYAVEDGALVEYYHGAEWGHEDHPSLSREVVVAGLRLLPPSEAPSEAAVSESIARDEAARGDAKAAHDQGEADRLARFEQSLPELPPGERIGLVWRYDGDDVVIARAGGEELWRDPDWPWLGKTLYRRLARVAGEKYGDRLTGFEVDVPADDYGRFDND